MTTEKKSIYQRAGEWGVPFGLYLSCAAVASIFADRFPPLSYVFLIMLVCTPLVVYRFQRHKFIEDGGFAEHSSLWMLGIMLFMLGSVISSLVVYLVLQYLRPGFLYEQAQAVIEVYSKLPQASDRIDGSTPNENISSSGAGSPRRIRAESSIKHPLFFTSCLPVW